MNNEILELLFALVRYKLCDEELNEQYKANITPQLLKSLYDLSNHHDIAHVIADALEKNDMVLENDEASYLFRQSKIKAIYRYVNQEYELGQICNILESEKIPFIPLKGAVLKQYWREPYMRTSCDIDILIHSEDCERAVNVLVEKLNYKSEANTTLHDYQLFSQSGVHLELHYTLLDGERMPKANELLEKAWNYTAPVENYQYNLKFSNEMFMYYHIVHMAKHFLNGGCGIKPFIDMWIINKSMKIDYVKLNEMLESASLLTFYEKSTALSRIWLSKEAYENITKEMEAFVISGGVYGNLYNSVAISASKGEGKLKTFFKIMFLPRKNLELIYPRLKKYPILLPFYQIKRWFRIFKKDKRKKLSSYSTNINNLSEGKIQSVNDLLNELNLE